MRINFMGDIILEFGVVYFLKGDGGRTGDFCVLEFSLFNGFGTLERFLFDGR